MNNVQGIGPTPNSPILDPIKGCRILNAELLQLQEAIQAFGFKDPFSLEIAELIKSFRNYHSSQRSVEKTIQKYIALLQEAFKLQMAQYLLKPTKEQPYTLVRYIMEWLDKLKLTDDLKELWGQYHHLFQQQNDPAEILRRRQARQNQGRNNQSERVAEYARKVMQDTEEVIQRNHAATDKIIEDLTKVKEADQSAIAGLKESKEKLENDIEHLEKENEELDHDLDDLDEKVDAAEKENKAFQREINRLEIEIKKKKKKWVKDLLKAAGGVAIGLGLSVILGPSGLTVVAKPGGGLLRFVIPV